MMNPSELLLTSSVLILAVLALRHFGRGRLSRRLCYGLWLVVLLRLLVPVSLPSPTSVLNLPAAQSAERFLAQRVEVITPDGAASSRPETAEPAAPEETAPAAETLPQFSPLVLIWAAGALGTSGWFLWVNARFARQLRRARRELPVPESPLPVWVAEGIGSPCLFGLLRPAVYLTPEAAADPVRRRHVLTHELCHWRQKDHIWAAARTLCLILYWFDPLVWLAAAASREDCELACDERTVRTLGEEENLAYGQTLVELVRTRQNPGELGSLATTMSVGRRGLKERVRLIIAAPVTRKSALAALVLMLGILVSCTFTGGVNLTGTEALEALTDSIQYEDSKVSFTIPEGYAPASDWEIRVYGRAAMGDSFMSVHLFEEESSGHLWEAGKTYSIDLAETQYDELWLEATLKGIGQGVATDLLEEAGGGPTVTALPEGYKLVSATLPMNQAEYAPAVPEFELRLAVPESWEVSTAGTEDGPINNLGADLVFRDGETLMGVLGCSGYEPYDGEIAPEDEYKSVYSSLRLSSFEIWDPYTPIQTLDYGETGRMEVQYKDAAWAEAHPEVSNAGVPSLETTGLVSFNRELGVYIALRFEPGAEISDDTLDTIARTVRLSPADADEAQWDYGPTGKRYPGSFSDRYDFSDTVILDADGSNVTGILLDLWYCASAAYDVDDMVLFPWQDTTTFSDGSVYYDLPDYDRVIRSIFTPEAIEAYEASDVVRIQKTDDGRVWRLGPWKTGYSYAMALSGLQAVSVEPDRMVIRAAYETMDGGIDRDEDPTYVPSYRTVDFTVEKTDGIWYVAEYTYPEEAFRLEQEAAVAAVEAALERLHPGASVDTIAYESDSTDGAGQTIRFRVDYSVGTTGYQNTLWTATCSGEGEAWQAAETPAE